jgi:hypothetical protein
MTTSRFTWARIGAVSTVVTVATGLGAGISAAIRGGSITESASVVGLGSGLFIASVCTAGRFGFFAEQPKSIKPSDHVIIPALVALIGTAIGYIGTKLLINAAASTEPFVDAALGMPITVGAMFCCKCLIDSYNQSQNEHTNSARRRFG